jgi:glycosyltransferase involved in cell wall biosynthesis
LKDVFEKNGHTVKVQTYTIEDRLPVGIRHLVFLFKILPFVWEADEVITLDTFSVGFPTVIASKFFHKKCIVRTGGDFLWEQYVERTGAKVLLKNFYQTEMKNLSRKERTIFRLTQRTLRRASYVVFSTTWQRDIFIQAYGISLDKTSIIENYYSNKEEVSGYNGKVFLGSGRNIKLKNTEMLKTVFDAVHADHSDASLFLDTLGYERFVEKIKKSYAVINVSLSEISPNLILEAIQYGKPFICTREVGIYERIKDVGVYVNPLDTREVQNAIVYLLDEDNYQKEVEKIQQFHFVHTWEDIGKEFEVIFKSQ